MYIQTVKRTNKHNENVYYFYYNRSFKKDGKVINTKEYLVSIPEMHLNNGSSYAARIENVKEKNYKAYLCLIEQLKNMVTD